jgi:hypothetical protein
MPDDPKDELLRKSGALGLAKEVVEYANPVQAEILLTLNRQNLSREETNRIIFKKLDEAANNAALAVTTAQAAHEEVMGIGNQIEIKFKELNGSISKTIERVQGLEYKNQVIEKSEAEKKIFEEGVREGNWLIPKKKRIWLLAVWGWTWKTIMGLLSFLGACALAWPAIKPFMSYLSH